MRKKELLACIAASALPADIKEYCARAAAMKTPCGLKAALRLDPAAFIKDLGGLLAAGGAALGCPAEELLFRTGFNKNDMGPGRFEAALAELRAALFLAGEGFSGLTLLRQGAATGADISGRLAGQTYIFEVRCLLAGGGAGPLDYLFNGAAASAGPGRDAVKYLSLKYEKKIRQVNSSRKRTGGKYGGVILALAPAVFSGGPAASALRALAEAVYRARHSPPFTHIVLLAGPAGAAYPAWP
ncbi:MAG TPA: hypothetical protein PKI19_02120 [Elusimicrobiales bacterium]|nr:hypothetical protein [Elusimicrobiales bacterium]